MNILPHLYTGRLINSKGVFGARWPIGMFDVVEKFRVIEAMPATLVASLDSDVERGETLYSFHISEKGLFYFN